MSDNSIGLSSQDMGLTVIYSVGTRAQNVSLAFSPTKSSDSTSPASLRPKTFGPASPSTNLNRRWPMVELTVFAGKFGKTVLGFGVRQL